MPKENKVTFGFRLKPSLLSVLRKYSDSEGVNPTDVITELIIGHLYELGLVDKRGNPVQKKESEK